MRLDEYISEAISSGRTLSRKAESAPRSQKLEDVKVWLEGIGVPFFEDYGRFEISNAYLTNDGKNFAVLFPENVTGKEVLFVAKITPSGYVKPLRMSVGGKVVDAFEPNNRLDVDKFFDKISETATGVTEAVSSGRRKNGYAPSEGCTIYDLKDWLDSKGVEGHDWVIDYQMSPEKPGQIIYLTGPCDTPGHTWISVSNHVKKNGSWVMQRIVIPVKIDRFHTPFITSGYGEEFPLSFDSAIEGIEYMIEHPTSYLVRKNDSVISEAISSGRSKYTPQFGDTVEDLVEWLYRMGVKDGVQYNGSFHYPLPGKIMYEIGPCMKIKDDTWWIQVIGRSTDESFQQTVTIQTKKPDSCEIEIEEYKPYLANKRVPYLDKLMNGLSFDEAIRMVLDMIEDTDKKVI